MRKLVKLAAIAGGAFGLWKAADEGLPRPKLDKIFNTTATSTVQEYKLPQLAVPENKENLWRVRLGAWEMAGGGHHTFLEFSPLKPTGEIYQIHGISMDEQRHDHAALAFGKASTYYRYFTGVYRLKALGVHEDYNKNFFNKKPDAYVDVFYGSKDEVLKMYLDGLKIAESINKDSAQYILLDHNSNSVQRTMLEGLGLPVPELYNAHRVTALAGRIWTPGMELSLLPKNWDRTQAREQGGYKTLTAEALDEASKQASGVKRVWDTGP